MVLVPSHAANVIPGVGLVAEEALLDAGTGLPGDCPIHHREMHHVVAGWRLVALHAILRTRRGMTEIDDRPGGGVVAVLAVAPEQRPVRIAIDVAAATIERRQGTRGKRTSAERPTDNVRPAGVKQGAQPGKGVAEFPVTPIGFYGAGMGCHGQHRVIHVDRPPAPASVLHMAAGTLTDVGVEYRRGLRQQLRRGDGMAGKAGRCLYPPGRRVAGLALRAEEVVCSREPPWTGRRGPPRHRGRA